MRKPLKKLSSYINFRHPLSDALSIVRALPAYEISSDPEEFCTMQHKHARILYEMSKLWRQLVHIYITFSKNADTKVIPTYSEMNAFGVEGEWKATLGDNNISTKHEHVLRQAISAGWAGRLACKLSLQDLITVHRGRRAMKTQGNSISSMKHTRESLQSSLFILEKKCT